MEIFALTKREQRAVILIVLTLLAATLAIHYRSLRAEISALPPVPTKSVSPNHDDDSATPEESP